MLKSAFKSLYRIAQKFELDPHTMALSSIGVSEAHEVSVSENRLRSKMGLADLHLAKTGHLNKFLEALSHCETTGIDEDMAVLIGNDHYPLIWPTVSLIVLTYSYTYLIYCKIIDSIPYESWSYRWTSCEDRR